jgi:uncharacterized glyoxalase superfamily protein PhnB
MMGSKQTTAVVRELWPLLFVEDIDRSIAFYRDQLGFTLARQATDGDGRIFWCRVERGGCSVMLQQAEEAEDGPAEGRGRGVIFYFICDDVDVMHAELARRGMRLDPPKVAYYGMKQLFVPEPDGYELCFESEV